MSFPIFRNFVSGSLDMMRLASTGVERATGCGSAELPNEMSASAQLGGEAI